jgi:hypothetical protein
MATVLGLTGHEALAVAMLSAGAVWNLSVVVIVNIRRR